MLSCAAVLLNGCFRVLFGRMGASDLIMKLGMDGYIYLFRVYGGWREGQSRCGMGLISVSIY